MLPAHSSTTPPLIAMSKLLFALLMSSALCALSSCGTSSSAPDKPTTTVAPVRTGNTTDFSGNWEKNYQLSDDFNTKFQLYVADIQRRFSRSPSDTAGFSPAAGLNGNAINGLARFAEELTRMPILDIQQTNEQITIAREDDFTLRCRYNDRVFARTNNPFGNELCGWTREQLLFQMQLAGGLNINHQFTLSPDGSQLNVTTTVTSADVAAPIVISNYYTRYTKNSDQYDCQLTLTRQRVCSQRGRQQ
jgi:hypothetical protein